MKEIKVECTACRAPYLVDAAECQAGKLRCIKCGSQTFAPLDKGDRFKTVRDWLHPANTTR